MIQVNGKKYQKSNLLNYFFDEKTILGRFMKMREPATTSKFITAESFQKNQHQILTEARTLIHHGLGNRSPYAGGSSTSFPLTSIF